MAKLVVLLFIISCACAFGISSPATTSRFLSCLHSKTPKHAPGTPTFRNLTSLSFRNNFATPLAIVTARNPDDIADAIRCARKAGIGVCARSGGHSMSGQSLCKGVLIDVGLMRRVTVDKNAIATIESGANMGEVLWTVWQSRRWLAAGVCAGVGASGYFLGGGHGPYEGRLGIGCDFLEEVQLINRFGRKVTASKTINKELFWGTCGAGGGQFGIVTYFRMRTASSAPYDNAVVFRFNWKQENIGALLEKWMDYDESNGDVWFRMEMHKRSAKHSGIDGLGACFNVSSVSECESKLSKAAFFNTPGRTTLYTAKVKNALDLHAWFGPEADWGRSSVQDLRKALLGQRYVSGGHANFMTFQSAFLKKGTKNRPSAQFWQQLANFCANPNPAGIQWMVCQFNLFNNAIDSPQNNAFAHRDADIITHFSFGGSAEDRKLAYTWMRNHMSKYISGEYVSYPELELKNEYSRLYWGKNLWRLRLLKTRYDPDIFFMNAQPIPPARKSLWRWAQVALERCLNAIGYFKARQHESKL